MDLEETELYEGFGLEIPEEGSEDPESAPPDGGTQDEGNPTTASGGPPPLVGEASAEAEEAPPEGNPLGEQGENPGGTGPHPEGAAVIPAFSAENARAAQQAAVDQAYAAAYAGKLDPYTGRPITSKAEFDQYQAALHADQRRQQEAQMRSAGVDPAYIQSMIDSHPTVQQAQAVIQAAETERARAQTEQARGWYGEQIKQINTLDPEAKLGRLEDLAAREPEQYGKMLDMVGRGVSMVDAYKMVHFDELAAKRSAAAQQTVRNQTAGKGHLVPSAGQGKAGVEVPGGVREMYREINPGMTDAQISTAYAAYLKETGQG